MPKFEISYKAGEKIQIRQYEPIEYGHSLKRVVSTEYDIDTPEGLEELQLEYMRLEAAVEDQVLRKRKTAFKDFNINQNL